MTYVVLAIACLLVGFLLGFYFGVSKAKEAIYGQLGVPDGHVITGVSTRKATK